MLYDVDEGRTREQTVGGRVLVVGTDDWAIEQGAEVLTAVGFTVLRCHDAGAPTFPCNALRPGGVCPVEAGVEVVVDIRARPSATPDPNEFGVVCAVRDRIPLVVGGLGEHNPFSPWATVVVQPSGDLVSAVETIIGRAAADIEVLQT